MGIVIILFGSDLIGGSHCTNRRLVPVWGYHINCSVYMSCDLEGQGNITVVVVAFFFFFFKNYNRCSLNNVIFVKVTRLLGFVFGLLSGNLDGFF